MTCTTPSTKNRAKTAKKDSNRSLGLVLAGFTALVIAAIAAVAEYSTPGSTETGNFMPNDEGWFEKALGPGG